MLNRLAEVEDQEIDETPRTLQFTRSLGISQNGLRQRQRDVDFQVEYDATAPEQAQ